MLSSLPTWCPIAYGLVDQAVPLRGGAAQCQRLSLTRLPPCPCVPDGAVTKGNSGESWGTRSALELRRRR